MKKTLIATCMAVTFIVLSILPAFATTTSYTLDELNMTIDVPKEFATLTRNVKEDDPNIKLFGFKTPREVNDLLKAHNGYLNTSPKNGAYGILVTMKVEDNGKKLFDLNLLTNKELDQTIKKATKLNSKQIKYTSNEIYQHKQAKFIIFRGLLNDGSNQSYLTQYFTIYNGQTISINLYSYTGPATPEAELQQKEIVDSIIFTKKVKRPFSPFRVTGKSNVDMAIVGLEVVAIGGIFFAISKIKARKKNVKK
jgi:hypothetical protein